MPQLGLGTWLSQTPGSVKAAPGLVPDAVQTALDVGYRHIDCAMAYGNQNDIGNVFEKVFGQGQLKREDVFVTSKLWNVFHSESRASEGVEVILRELRLPYLDMLLIHWPQGYDEHHGMFPKDEDGKMMYSDVDYMETWRAMEGAVRAGKVRSIGVANFNSQQVDRINREGNIPVSNLQVEAHPYFSQEGCIRFCKERGIVMTAYSPLANNSHLFRTGDQPNLLTDPVLVEIANAYKKTPAQVAIRWAIQRGTVVIPKSCTPSRIKENYGVWDFQLSDEDMGRIASLERGLQILTLAERDWNHPHYPFKVKF